MFFFSIGCISLFVTAVVGETGCDGKTCPAIGIDSVIQNTDVLLLQQGSPTIIKNAAMNTSSDDEFLSFGGAGVTTVNPAPSDQAEKFEGQLSLNEDVTVEVELGKAGKACEGGSSPILSEAACWAAMDRLADGKGCKWGNGCNFDHFDWDGDDYDYYGGVETAKEFPPGCYYETSQKATWFNKDSEGKVASNSQSYCAKGFDVTNAKLLFAGDSDIDYWRQTSVDFPGSFNIGIGGSTCKQWTSKVDWVVKEFHPKTVVLVCGENDLPGDSAKTTFNNFKKVVETFLNSGARVLALGTKPEPGSHKDKLHKKYNEYDYLIRAFAKDIHGQSDGPPRFVFIDVNPSFLEIDNPKSLYDADELHMSSEGYSKWVSWTRTALADMDSNYLECWLWQNGRCVAGPSLGNSGNSCPSGFTKIFDEAGCEAAAIAMSLKATDACKTFCGDPGWKTETSGFKSWIDKNCGKYNCKGCSPCRVTQNKYKGVETDADWPSGCYYCSDVDGCADGTWFNKHGTGSANGDAKPYCVQAQQGD
jgi:lysophospholipase L1-like esterase